MMARYVLLRIENDEEADRLIEDMRNYPDSDLLTPCQENTVHATLVSDSGAQTRIEAALKVCCDANEWGSAVVVDMARALGAEDV